MLERPLGNIIKREMRYRTVPTHDVTTPLGRAQD